MEYQVAIFLHCWHKDISLYLASFIVKPILSFRIPVEWFDCLSGVFTVIDSSWNVMAHGDAREGKWRGNWRMEWVASIIHTTSENGVSRITTADAHTSAASSRLNWDLCRFKWSRPFRRKTKSDFCADAITFQTQSTFPNEHVLKLTVNPVLLMAVRVGFVKGKVR